MGQTGQVGYKQLLVWQKAHELAVGVYKVSRSTPREDRWLQQQICRAALSVPSNIAEGYTRRSRKEYLQGLNVARASLAEVEYQLYFMRQVDLIDDSAFASLDGLRVETGVLLNRLIRSIGVDPTASQNGRTLGEPVSEYFAGDLASDCADFDDQPAISLVPDD